jgi:hypothetical protein
MLGLPHGRPVSRLCSTSCPSLLPRSQATRPPSRVFRFKRFVGGPGPAAGGPHQNHHQNPMFKLNYQFHCSTNLPFPSCLFNLYPPTLPSLKISNPSLEKISYSTLTSHLQLKPSIYCGVQAKLLRPPVDLIGSKRDRRALFNLIMEK